MNIQLIRNATMKMTYAGRTLLTDPMLAPKDAYKPFAGIARNPTIELPMPVEAVVQGIEAVAVSHDHPDHFDQTARDVLPKTVPVFCQPQDEAQISQAGFTTVIAVETTTTWEEITITRTDGRHGSGKVLDFIGSVSGFVFEAGGEPTVYWVGDSIWCGPVEESIDQFKPDIIVTHSGGARLPGYETIIMDAEQTLTTAKSAPQSKVVAIHLEALDHCGVSRRALRQMAQNEAIPRSRLIIPQDGETITF